MIGKGVIIEVCAGVKEDDVDEVGRATNSFILIASRGVVLLIEIDVPVVVVG